MGQEPSGGEWRRKHRPRMIGLRPAWGQMPKSLFMALMIAGVFNACIVAAWVGFALNWVGIGAPAFCSAVGVFTIPLFIGAVEAVMGRRSGRWLLRIGSFLFIFFWDLASALDLWDLDDLPQYREFLAASRRS